MRVSKRGIIPGVVPNVPKNGISYMSAHGMRNSNQILRVIKVNERKICTGSTTPPAAVVRNFCDTNADARSVRGSEPSCSRFANRQ